MFVRQTCLTPIIHMPNRVRIEPVVPPRRAILPSVLVRCEAVHTVERVAEVRDVLFRVGGGVVRLGGVADVGGVLVAAVGVGGSDCAENERKEDGSELVISGEGGNGKRTVTVLTRVCSLARPRPLHQHRRARSEPSSSRTRSRIVDILSPIIVHDPLMTPRRAHPRVRAVVAPYSTATASGADGRYLVREDRTLTLRWRVTRLERRPTVSSPTPSSSASRELVPATARAVSEPRRRRSPNQGRKRANIAHVRRLVSLTRTIVQPLLLILVLEAVDTRSTIPRSTRRDSNVLVEPPRPFPPDKEPTEAYTQSRNDETDDDERACYGAGIAEKAVATAGGAVQSATARASAGGVGAGDDGGDDRCDDDDSAGGSKGVLGCRGLSTDGRIGGGGRATGRKE